MKPILLHDELVMAADAYGEAIAFQTPSATFSYRHCADRARDVAIRLQASGLKPGERLAILAGNSVDYMIYHYAASMAGLIFHVLNTRLAAAELAWMLNDAESAALIADDEFAAMAVGLQAACPTIRHLIRSDQDLPSVAAELITPQMSPADPVVMIYTSGTTGRPKGALQSHQGSVAANQNTRNAVAITSDDIYLAMMPFFHQAGLIRTRATLLAGGKVIVPGKLDANGVADAIVDYGVTFTMIASPQQETAIREKLRAEGAADFHAFRLLLGGGGGGVKRMARLKAMCVELDCVYFGVYGQTETSGPAVFITEEDAFERPDSCGRPFPDVDIEIWIDGEPQAPGVEGEIMIRGPITASYWRNDPANEALYTREWVHTGDVGSLDADGFLYFKGRVKELVKTGAENVYPREVEAVIEAHEAVRDVAMFGVPDAKWGELVCVAVVLNSGQTLNLEEIRAFCRDKIGGYKIPKRLIIVDNIQRNHTGKILRNKLVEIAAKEAE
jgi:acyl-CoA synthetase (AMP-forming)/AMP-acid ligase II